MEGIQMQTNVGDIFGRICIDYYIIKLNFFLDMPTRIQHTKFFRVQFVLILSKMLQSAPDMITVNDYLILTQIQYIKRGTLSQVNIRPWQLFKNRTYAVQKQKVQ